MQKNHRPRATGEGRMSRPVPRGGGNIDRYAYIAYIIQAAGEGRMSRSTAVGGRRRKDVRFPGGGGGGRGETYIVMPI